MVDERRVGFFPTLSTDPVLRCLATIAISLGLALSFAQPCANAQEGLIDIGAFEPASQIGLPWSDGDVFQCHCGVTPPAQGGNTDGCLICGSPAEDDLSWLDSVRVGYDGGFVIASRRDQDLGASNFPFRLRINGWGQLRYTSTDFAPPSNDLNQFQLKRARIIFSGNAFNPDVSYFVQLDGRSSSGDNLRLLDYYLSYDVGHDQFGLRQGTLGFRTGKFKMPFTMARWLSGKQFEFTDRSVASMYFDVNRSLAWGLYGQTQVSPIPISWETTIFNGFVTGGAETGSSGDLDDNFAFAIRASAEPIGQWGSSQLADFEGHERLAMRVGAGFAATTVNRSGSTEFNTVRVVDSGETLATILPSEVDSYSVTQFAVDASFKLRGWSSTFEYYFRNVSDFRGATLPDLFDHGFWFQLGYFVVPSKLQLLTRWSRVDGDSGTLGAANQSADEVAGGFAWYFRSNHAKLVGDLTHVDGSPINSSSLDLVPGDRGWLFRTQIQFSF